MGRGPKHNFLASPLFCFNSCRSIPPLLRFTSTARFRLFTGSTTSRSRGNKMKLVLLLIFASYMCLVVCRKPSPSTCYSRMLDLSKEIMDVLDRLHKHNQTKACAKMLPTIFLDVHNSCMVSKLRDFLYVVENLPSVSCRARPRITLLRRKAQNLFTIINRVCYRDLVYFTDDCEAIDTGIISPRYGGDRLQLLTEN